MIFAWIETCGVRMSSPFTKLSIWSMRVCTSVITSALFVVSATTEPRDLVTIDCTAGMGQDLQPLRFQHGVERQVPRLVLHLGGDLAGDPFADDDGAAAEGGEPGAHVLD